MATKTEPWWKGGIVYEIYPRSFKDTDGDGVGDLKGITENLDYVASLGVDAIWITPFFRSPMDDFGYDVSDYRAVDPIFGTNADFQELIEAAHYRELKVLVDYVISHTSDQHEWFKESRSSRDNPKADWYVWADPKPDGTAPNNWLSVFGGQSWQFDTRRQQYYLHNFLVSQPDLNIHNPKVQTAILAEMKFWLDAGVDGFRLDALNFAMHDAQLRDNPPAADPSRSEQPVANPYSRQQHLYDKSRDELLPFLQQVRTLLNQYENATTLAEVGDDYDRTLELIAGYSAGGDKIHMCYGFDFLSSKFSATYVRSTIERYLEGAGEGWPCWAFSNHDVTRHVSRWAVDGRGEREVALFSMALILSLRGSICLYQGEELGLPEGDIKFEDLQDPAGKTFWPEYKGRDGCRTPMPWDATKENGGFGAGKPWLPVSPAHLSLSVAAQEADADSILANYRAAIDVRDTSDALRIGDIRFEDAAEGLLVHHRTTEDQHILCVLNFTNAPVAYPQPEGVEVLLASGSSTTEIEALGYRWYWL